MKRIILFSFLFHSTSLFSQAPMQELNKGIGIRKTFQDFNTFHDRDFDAFREYSNGIELFVQKSFSKSLKVVIPIGIITVSDSSRDYALDPTLTLGAQAQFRFLKSDHWFSPFVVGGLNAAIPKLADFYLNVPLGLGVNFNLHPQVALQWQSDFRLPIVNGKTYLQHSFGIAYLLGNLKKPVEQKMLETEALLDTDGDSIPDQLDLCPSVVGLRIFMGCPDTDGDGVADKDDRCPETAGIKALRGCPDTDEDGVVDSDDECPNVAGTKSNKGCPEEKEKDSDGDGIMDKKDICPELKGSSKTNGCPDMDNDGVADKDDRCPEIAGLKSKGGCPEEKEKDSDGDGIADKEDKCPDVKGIKKLNGCPEKIETKPIIKDSDNDGITDDKDLCPDKAGLLEMSGCPDSDGDGVADTDDKCPDVKGIKKLDGCPEKIETKPIIKDSDKDGITDDKDLCPDIAGLFEMSGCPDSDGDGITDKEDNCPTIYGLKINKGCPEVKKDSDGDGIIDDKDDCPFAAGLDKFNGCPDTDGDGIHDKIDKCPKAIGPLSNNGCPVIEKKDLEVLDYAMRAVQFDLSRSTLREESFAVLDKISNILIKYPAYNLLISGHTDNTGSEKLNLDLSDRRAKVCRDYLVSRGLPPGRMSAVGYGSSQPIADNKTDTGKFLNRRTEFSLVAPK